jgi:hypothetical protein
MTETKPCIACAEDIRSNAVLCKYCKTRQDDVSFKQTKSSTSASSNKQKGKTSSSSEEVQPLGEAVKSTFFRNLSKSQKVWMIIFFVLLFAFIGNSISDNRSSLQNIEIPEVTETQEAVVEWLPEGFTAYGVDLGWRWADASCAISSARCNHLEVVSKDGCSSLYAEVNFVDSAGTIVDWSNDTARGMGPLQMALLEFRTFEDSASASSVSEINCR